MNQEKLDQEAQHGLTEFVKSRSCSVGGVGTGNIVHVDGRLFIATCRHVADKYYRLDRPYVIFRDNQRIPTDQLKYVRCTNRDIDLALIEIQCPCNPPASFERGNFEVIEDFSQYSFDKTNLFLCGFPSDLSYQNDEGRFHPWMSYMTIPSETQPPTIDHLFAQYDTSREDNITSDGRRTILPKAQGFSGAFVFKVKEFEGSQSDLWTPDHAKVIAMQSSWDKKNWIKGSNIKHLIAMFDELMST